MHDRKEHSPLSSARLYLRYIRLPNHVLELYDELVFRSERVIVGNSLVTSAHPVVFEGKAVLTAGFRITYFKLMRRWFTVGKIRDARKAHGILL